MKKQYLGLDILRGIGIFVLLIMHTAFYFFDGIYGLDFNDPPLVVTLIGFLLMFAGLFGMLSGAVHMIGISRARQGSRPMFRRKLTAGVFVLVVAYAYFIFTGPGIIDIAGGSMNNSIGVELLRHGRLIGTNLERLLYVDSLVMIGTNIILLGALAVLLGRFRTGSDTNPRVYLALGILFMLFSLLRIPAYNIYTAARDSGQWSIVLALNWLVNKNNPILPYFSFALLGAWLGLLAEKGRKALRSAVLPALLLLVAGIAAYVVLPDTMLERQIDLKWFAIMTMQLGLFTLLLLGALRLWDVPSDKPPAAVVRFFARFGVAGFTPFFLESMLAALAFRALSLFFPGASFGLAGALAFGLVMAMIWGAVLIPWEKTGYAFGVEDLYLRTMTRVGGSTKADKLQGGASTWDSYRESGTTSA